jgi:hypothetical protein
MVQTLNLILLTANEVEDLRQSLRKSFQKENATKEDIQVFTVSFSSFKNSISYLLVLLI